MIDEELYEDQSQTQIVGQNQTLDQKKTQARQAIQGGVPVKQKAASTELLYQPKPALELQISKQIYNAQDEGFKNRYKPPSDTYGVLTGQALVDRKNQSKAKLAQFQFNPEQLAQQGSNVLKSIFKAATQNGNLVGGFDTLSLKFKGSALDKKTGAIRDFSTKYFKNVTKQSVSTLLRGNQAEATLGAAVQVASNWNRLIRSIDQFNQISSNFAAFQKRKQARINAKTRGGVLLQKLQYIKKARKFNRNLKNADEALTTLDARTVAGLTKIRERVIGAGARRKAIMDTLQPGAAINQASEQQIAAYGGLLNA